MDTFERIDAICPFCQRHFDYWDMIYWNGKAACPECHKIRVQAAERLRRK